MIDYQYPIMKRMKQAYSTARASFERADNSYRRKLGDVKDALNLALRNLETAKAQILELIGEIEAATDLSEDDRRDYISEFNVHLGTIDTWHTSIREMQDLGTS